MAKMIPPIIPTGTKSSGEREIFELLKYDLSTENWIVLHSLDTAKHIKQIFGEIDFVIIVPHKGILVLEVKAVKTLSRQNGEWHYGMSSDKRGPFKQASMAMHSLKSYVDKYAPDVTGLVYWSAVCFPFIEFNEKSIEWHSWQVIDKAAMNRQSFSGLILNVLQSARTYLASQLNTGWFKPNLREPSNKQVAKISQILRPEFELYESPKSRKKRLNQELKKYTNEQILALDAMEDNKRVVFSGLAGTGKTLLAIETARRLASVGKKVLFICFNKQLSIMLEEELAATSNIRISTLHSYLKSLAEIDSLGDGVDFWQNELPNLALEKVLDSQHQIYDALVLDETQDILYEQYLEILDLCIVDGFRGGKWRAFGDFAKQNIYSSENQISFSHFMNTYGKKAVLYSLRTNCRNTPQIASIVSNFGMLEPGYNKILRPDNAIPIKAQYYKDNKQQINLLVKSLSNLQSEGFTEDEIVVLSTKSNLNSCAGNLEDGLWQNLLEPYVYQTSFNKIRYSSIHAFKGLESPIVIITDIETLSDLESNQLIYVATSRAFHRLIIIASIVVQKEIESHLSKNLVTS